MQRITRFRNECNSIRIGASRRALSATVDRHRINTRHAGTLMGSGRDHSTHIILCNYTYRIVIAFNQYTCVLSVQSSVSNSLHEPKYFHRAWIGVHASVYVLVFVFVWTFEYIWVHLRYVDVWFLFLWNTYHFERTILSRERTFPRTCFKRVSWRIVHEAFIRRDTRVTMVYGTVHVPGLGGILLSVRVSREDDNAHGIAVASFSAHLIARQDEALWYCARIRPETRDVLTTLGVFLFCNWIRTECLTTIWYILCMVPIRVTLIGEHLLLACQYAEDNLRSSPLPWRHVTLIVSLTHWVMALMLGADWQ